ncbi:MAG TPA: adenosine deaminase [Nanoarchaeota archaeon]|nr:adenosine deaminase [Nanoarchaeota archaeon]
MASELHLHLDGSMRIGTLVELARFGGISLPSYDAKELLSQIKFKQGMTQEECLAAFATTLSVMQTEYAISRIAYEICEDNWNRGINHVEIRYCPFLHQGKGLGIEAIVGAVQRGISLAEKNCGIRACQIFGALRHDTAERSEELAGIASYYHKEKPDYKVAGFDLCCAEANNPPWKHDKAFMIAQEAGLKITVHAGEVPGSLDYLRYAICAMKADRIGHGTLLIEDERLIQTAKRLGTTIECCVTSNVHTGIIKDLTEHPAKRLFDAGVRIAFCADNSLLSQTTMERELRIAMHVLGFTKEDLEKCLKYSDEARFLK